MNSDKTKSSRRSFVAAALVLAGASSVWKWRDHRQESSVATDANVTEVEVGVQFLADHPSIDIHSHAGRSFLANGDFANPALKALPHGFEAARIADMQAGQVTAGLFAIVADIQVLGFTPEGAVVPNREFDDGEAYADFKRQLNYFSSLRDSDVISFALTSEDIVEAHQNGDSVAVLACEGGDFIEDRLERLEEAYVAGVRSIGPVHYRPNEYGDIQTAAPEHGGLTALGRDVVQEMNHQGILIDAAHATLKTTRDLVNASSAPVMLSHSQLGRDGVSNARLISPQHADLIADNNGIVGAWPSGITNKSMSDFADEIFRLIDRIGVDHVAIGTDLDANYKPVLTDYAQFPAVATELLARGLSVDEAAKLMGGNFLRVFSDVASLRQA